jgi:hypothetical protein
VPSHSKVTFPFSQNLYLTQEEKSSVESESESESDSYDIPEVNNLRNQKFDAEYMPKVTLNKLVKDQRRYINIHQKFYKLRMTCLNTERKLNNLMEKCTSKIKIPRERPTAINVMTASDENSLGRASDHILNTTSNKPI